MKSTIKALLADESGQGYTEYAILLGFVSILGMVAVKALGTKLSSTFNTYATELP